MFSKPVVNAMRIVSLSGVDLGLNKSVIRVSSRHIDGQKLNRKKFARNMTVAVINNYSKQKIIATVWGDDAKNKDNRLKSDEIALDYDARDLLGLNRQLRQASQVNVTVRPALWWEVYSWFWGHPDPAYKISTRLALIGMSLGAISFFQAIIAAFI